MATDMKHQMTLLFLRASSLYVTPVMRYSYGCDEHPVTKERDAPYSELPGGRGIGHLVGKRDGGLLIREMDDVLFYASLWNRGNWLQKVWHKMISRQWMVLMNELDDYAKEAYTDATVEGRELHGVKTIPSYEVKYTGVESDSDDEMDSDEDESVN